jgi:hypothetical protein
MAMSRGACAVKKRKKHALPKPRHVWQINPKTRVAPSEKTYRRKAEKKKEKNWVEELLDLE